MERQNADLSCPRRLSSVVLEPSKVRGQVVGLSTRSAGVVGEVGALLAGAGGVGGFASQVEWLMSNFGPVAQMDRAVAF